MKLFKKMAAAALAAVLALSMVGCGAGSKSSTSTASELTNMLVDSIEQNMRIDAKHTTEMDNLAAALAASAGNAEDAENKDVKALLTANEVLTDAGFTAEDLQNTTYFVSYAENYKFKSSLTTGEEKIAWMAQQIVSDSHIQNVGKSGSPYDADALELGAGTVKIGDTEYIVMVAKVIEAAPDTTPEAPEITPAG